MLELLMEFDALCRDNGIAYCVCSGCALGLERNGGFLPWDDDVDLFITAENYERLDKILSESLQPNRAWITQQRYPYYENTVARYVDTSTTEILKYRINDTTPLGIYLEIFILDDYPDVTELQEEYDKYLWLYCELNATKYVVANEERFKEVYDSELYREYFNRIKVEGKESVLSCIWKHLNELEKGDNWLCVRWGSQRRILRKEWMTSIVYRYFEGVKLPFMCSNIRYLAETEYDYNWDYLPPKHRRKTHDAIICSDKSYLDCMEELSRITVLNGFDEKITRYKGLRVERRFFDLDVQEYVAAQKKVTLEMISKEITNGDLTTDYANISNLEQLFSGYLEIQSQPRYYLTGKKADIDDRVLNAMLYLLIYKNEIVLVKRLIKIYSEYEVHRVYDKVVKDICDLKYAKYAGATEEVEELVNSLDKLGYAKQLEVERCKVWLMSRSDIVTNEDSFLNLLEGLENQDDLEIQKYCGDYYIERDVQIGLEYYRRAIESNNGMLLKDISRRLRVE